MAKKPKKNKTIIGDNPAEETTQESTKIQELEASNADLSDKMLRLHAEIDNIRKQNSIDLDSAKKMGKIIVLQSILDFLNNMNISFNFAPKSEDEEVVSYVETLRKNFEKITAELANIGVELIAPETGADFDAQTMQTLAVTEETKVKAVIKLGYKIDGQVDQPAVVML